jgi:hypothetical protein
VRSANTAPVSFLGASDATDRFKIRFIRRTPAGRDSVGYEYQVAARGQAFGAGVNGTAGPADSGAPSGGASATDTEKLVTGLAPQTVYRWRVRHFSHNPLFPASRWFSIQGNNATEADFRTPCTASTWYRDQDGDTYGNAAVTQSACAQPGGYVAVSGDCNDVDATMFPGNPEVCDGKDNNCNGTADDGFASPSARPGVGASKSGTTIAMNWAAVAGADRDDTVRGLMSSLRASAGDFTVATDLCVANDRTSPDASDDASTTPGDGFWYLVRAVNCTAAGSYDEAPGSQVGSRDAEIAASAAACP